MDSEIIDEALDTDSPDPRWSLYMRRTKAAGLVPMPWGAWLAAGQPVPED